MVSDDVAGPPAKKRGAARQISKDDGSDSEGDSSAPVETGTFQKASDHVMAGRRIVKVRRTGASSAPPAPNPFLSVRLEAPTVTPAAPYPYASISLVAPATTSTTTITSSLAPAASLTSTTAASEVVVSNLALVIGDIEEENQDSNNRPGGSGDIQEEKQHGLNETADQGNGEIVGEACKQVLESVEVSDPGLISGDGNAILNTSVEGEQTTVSAIPDEGNEGGKDCEGKPDAKSKDNVEGGSVDKGISKDSLPPLNKAVPGSFSFGTPPSSLETPTAFASFSSTWTAFGSHSASGTGLGSGVGYNRTSAEGASTFDSNNGSSFQLFNTKSNTTPSTITPSSQPPAPSIQFQGPSTHTGEEQEKVVFGAEATLFEFVESSWKERGKGELRVNAPIGSGGTSRLLMRTRGNHRLILNASIFPDMRATAMDGRGVRFACVNSAVEKRDGLGMYAVKFKDSLSVSDFREIVESQRRPPAQGGLKTPENSPSAVHGS